MKFYGVSFSPYGKIYVYKSNLDLHKNYIYDIIADNHTTYSNPVKVVEIWDGPAAASYETGFSANKIDIREITSATVVQRGRKKKDSGISRVFFNEEKGTTVVCWNDGTKTKVHCNEDDVFDREKGLAMCFVKRFFNNEGYYNDYFKQWCE